MALRNIHTAAWTDLALEASEAAGEIPGVAMEQEQAGSTLVTRVQVLTKEGGKRLGKPPGRYVTMENAALPKNDTLLTGEVDGTLAKELAAMLEATGFAPGDDALVAGLGNRGLTPDSLGPRVTGEVLVTRHIRALVPDALDERVRTVSAFSPGVMGATGIETGELIHAAIKVVKPKCLIVVDSLAAWTIKRVLSTVQLSDTGVAPGSGVGNHRIALTKQSLGVPVIAIGVPMVVRAAIIGKDITQRALECMIQREGEKSPLGRKLESYLEEHALGDLIRRATGEEMQGFVVTPVSIDEAVRNVAALVAAGINRALHKDLTREEILALKS